MSATQAQAQAQAQPAVAGRVQGQEGVTITVRPSAQSGDLQLQLEVFVNGRSLQMLVPFTMKADATLVTSAAELMAIGVTLPASIRATEREVPLHMLPGVTHRYDEAGQALHLTLAPQAQRPTLVGIDTARPPAPGAVRPPLGALLNYTLFASATRGAGGPRFGGVSGAFDARLFGSFGLVEHSFIGRTGAGGRFVRLETTYTWDDPVRLITVRAGDTISGGFSWTRPIRLAGLQLRRSFGLRPDLVTVAVPTLHGSAAAPSTLDLYVNEVRALSADVPLGPYRVAQPRVGSLSFTQDFGRFTVCGSASRDFDTPGSTAIFAGLSIPFGAGITGSAGGTYTGGRASGYVEAARQPSREPGSLGWAVRGSAGERQEAQAILRYATSFARFEATGQYVGGDASGTLMMEGGLVAVGGGLHFAQRLDDSFALVDVGAPGVTVLRENRVAGVSGRDGTLLVTDLAPFVANRIAIDPEALPIDARVARTEAVATPFARVPTYLGFGIQRGRGSALVKLVDPAGWPLALGSTVAVGGGSGSGSGEIVVGYDGDTYFDAPGRDNDLLVTNPDGVSCRARFAFAGRPGTQARIGPITCTPESR